MGREDLEGIWGKGRKESGLGGSERNHTAMVGKSSQSWHLLCWGLELLTTIPTMEAGAVKRLDLRYSISQTLHPQWPQGHVNLPFSRSPAWPPPTVVSEASVSLVSGVQARKEARPLVFPRRLWWQMASEGL